MWLCTIFSQLGRRSLLRDHEQKPDPVPHVHPSHDHQPKILNCFSVKTLKNLKLLIMFLTTYTIFTTNY